MIAGGAAVGLLVHALASNPQLAMPLAAAVFLLGIVFQERVLYYFIVGTMPLHHNAWVLSDIGFGAIPVLVPVLAASVIAKQMLKGSPFRFPKRMRPAIIFIALAALSIAFAESKADALNLMAWERAFVRVLLFPYVAWVIFISLCPEAQVKFLSRQTAVVLFVTFAGVVLSFLQVLTGEFYFISSQWENYSVHSALLARPIGLADYPIAWGVFLLIPFFMVLAEASAGIILYKWFAAGIILVGLVISGTRGAWLGGLVAMLWFFSKARHRRRAVFLPLLFVVLITGGVIFSVGAFRNISWERIETGEEGLIGRLPILLGVVNMAISHPIIGVGIGNVPIYLLNHARELLGDFRVEYWQHWIGRSEATHAHNMLLGIWAEIGTFGLLALCWLLWRGWQNFQSFSMPSGVDDSLSRGISLMRIRDGLQAAYLAIIVASFFQAIDHYLFLWFLLAASFMLKSYATRLRITDPQPALSVKGHKYVD